MRYSKGVCEFSLIFLVLAVSITALARAQEDDDENVFSYEESGGSGPSRWGEIRFEWKQCNIGQMQSPIDVWYGGFQRVSYLGEIRKSYKPADATLYNRGHDLMIRWTNDSGHIEITGTIFTLQQCHWHSPSEHTIHGRKFDMEVHLVHESDDGRTAVIGILYEIGAPDSFISQLESRFKAFNGTNDIRKAIGMVDPNLINFGNGDYYRYVGSLTVPPCTQNIIWSIVRNVSTVTKEQIKLIREVVNDKSEVNARPIQPANGRPVELYCPNDLKG